MKFDEPIPHKPVKPKVYAVERDSKGRFVNGHKPTNEKHFNDIQCAHCGAIFKRALGMKSKTCSQECSSEYRKTTTAFRNPEVLARIAETKRKSGYSPSAETRKKISDAQKGVPRPYARLHKWTEEEKKQIGLRNTKHGKTGERQKIRGSFEYKEWRKQVMKNHYWTCKMCGYKGKEIEAHHISSFDENEDKRLLPENGIVLCKSCHKIFHVIYGRGKNNDEQLRAFFKNISIRTYPKVYSVDIDRTITSSPSAWDEESVINAEPNREAIEKLNKLHEKNYIIIHTARRHSLYLPTIKWLENNGVKYHSICMNKMPADVIFDLDAVNRVEDL